MMASAQEIDNRWKPLVNLEDLLIMSLHQYRSACHGFAADRARSSRSRRSARRAGALHWPGGPTPAAGRSRSIVGLLRAPRAALGVLAALVAVGRRAQIGRKARVRAEEPHCELACRVCLLGAGHRADHGGSFPVRPVDERPQRRPGTPDGSKQPAVSPEGLDGRGDVDCGAHGIPLPVRDLLCAAV